MKEESKNTVYRIEVSVKEGFADPRSEGLLKDILDLGINIVERVRVSNIYLLEGKLNDKELAAICRELLTDPIVEEYLYEARPAPDGVHLVEVAYNPGVMDPVEDSVKKGIRDLGINTVTAVRTAKKYLLWGKFSEETLQSICDKLLVNGVVQHIVGQLQIPPGYHRLGRHGRCRFDGAEQRPLLAEPGGNEDNPGIFPPAGP
jgi:phosphoribosylformylglycinamidine synthase